MKLLDRIRNHFKRPDPPEIICPKCKTGEHIIIKPFSQTYAHGRAITLTVGGKFVCEKCGAEGVGVVLKEGQQ